AWAWVFWPWSSGWTALVLISDSVGDITKKLRNIASPTITWFGGIDCSPRALRVSDSTITMRVKLVSMMSSAGATDSSVMSTMIIRLWLGAPLVPGILSMTEASGALVVFVSVSGGTWVAPAVVAATRTATVVVVVDGRRVVVVVERAAAGTTAGAAAGATVVTVVVGVALTGAGTVVVVSGGAVVVVSGGATVVVVSGGAGASSAAAGRAAAPASVSAQKASRPAATTRRPRKVDITKDSERGSGPADGPFPQLLEDVLPWQGPGGRPWCAGSGDALVVRRLELRRVDLGQEADLVVGHAEDQRAASEAHDGDRRSPGQPPPGDDLHLERTPSAPTPPPGGSDPADADDAAAPQHRRRAGHDAEDDPERDDDADDEGGQGGVHRR